MNENIPLPPGAEMGPMDIVTLLIAAIIMIIPFWRIFSKAGYSGWLSILMVIPIINIILLYYLAFARWPIFKRGEGELREGESARDQTTRTPPTSTTGSGY